jgi:hypothetical protein
MMAITTSNSISVKAFLVRSFVRMTPCREKGASE